MYSIWLHWQRGISRQISSLSLGIDLRFRLKKRVKYAYGSRPGQGVLLTPVPSLLPLQRLPNSSGGLSVCKVTAVDNCFVLERAVWPGRFSLFLVTSWLRTHAHEHARAHVDADYYI